MEIYELKKFVSVFSICDVLDINQHTKESLFTLLTFYLHQECKYHDYLPVTISNFILRLWGSYNGTNNGASVSIKEGQLGLKNYYITLDNGEEVVLPPIHNLYKTLHKKTHLKRIHRNIYLSLRSKDVECINIPITMDNYTLLMESIFKSVKLWYHQVHTIELSKNQIDIKPMSEIVYSIIYKHTPKNQNTTIHLYLI